MLTMASPVRCASEYYSECYCSCCSHICDVVSGFENKLLWLQALQNSVLDHSYLPLLFVQLSLTVTSVWHSFTAVIYHRRWFVLCMVEHYTSTGNAVPHCNSIMHYLLTYVYICVVGKPAALHMWEWMLLNNTRQSFLATSQVVFYACILVSIIFLFCVLLSFIAPLDAFCVTPLWH